MKEYQSNYTGKQVDDAIGRVLRSTGKGDVNTPVYVDLDGEIIPIEKLSEVEEGSEALVTSDGIHKAIVASEDIVDAKIAASEGRSEDKIDAAKQELTGNIRNLESELGNINQNLTNRVNNLTGLTENKQDKLTAGDGIKIENNVISNTRVSAEWGKIEGLLEDQLDLKEKLDTMQSMIDGRTIGVVFDTKSEMDEYIQEKQAAGESIPIGFTFFIRDINEPNYWWDGEKAVESKQQKIDLTDYATKEYVTNAISTKQDKLEIVQLYKD